MILKNKKKDDDNYKNDTENLETVIKYYNKLKTFRYLLVTKHQDMQLSKTLLNIYKPYENKFLIFNRILQPNKEEYGLLINAINNPIELPCKIKFISFEVNINLFESALEELKNEI